MGSQRYVKILMFSEKIRAVGGSSYRKIKDRCLSDYFDIEMIKKDIGCEKVEFLNICCNPTIVRYIFMHSSPSKLCKTIEKEIVVSISNKGTEVEDVRLITYAHTYSHINKND